MKKYKIHIFTTLIVIMLMSLFSGCSSNKQEASKVKSINDLEGATIGVQLGTTGDIYASDYKDKGSTIQRYNKGTDAVQSLKQGKIDCIVIDEEPAKAFVKVNKDISILEEEFVSEDYAICISKEKFELKNKINDAINTIRSNGILQKIIDGYILDDNDYRYEPQSNLDRKNGKLIMATNAAFEPYEYRKEGEIVGIDVDIANAIADILDMELVIEDMEFDSIITAVQSGKADNGVAGMTDTEEIKKNIDFTESYVTSKQVVLVRNGNSANDISFKERIQNNFIEEDRWTYIVDGLGTTLLITVFAVAIGIALGFIIAILRVTCDKTGKCKILNWILKAYLTIIRGTPAMVQLLIIYYVIFSSTNVSKILVAVITFGLNSSAYVAEIIRSGINSIDPGQFEASRSIGFNYSQTMWNFILPQAIRNVLPALGNEVIVLIKETAISGYIGIVDLTRGGDYIRSRTYDAFTPLIAIALVYLIIVMILTKLVSIMERRLNNDRK